MTSVTRMETTAWPQRELIVVWAAGGALSLLGWGVAASFQPAIGYATEQFGWILVAVGTYLVLRSAGRDLGLGSLLILLSGWLVGRLAIAWGFDSSGPVVQALREMVPWGELLARYLSLGVAGFAIGFASSVVLLRDRVDKCVGVGIVWALLFCLAWTLAVYALYVGMLLQFVLGEVAGQITAHVLIGGLLGTAVGAVGNRLLRDSLPRR